MPEVELAIEAAPSSEVVTLADCSRAEHAERRFLAAMNVLVDDALEHKNMEILADVLAWTMGRVIVGCDTPVVTGDILRRLGNYVCGIAERRQAQEDADRARKHGLVPH